MFIAVCVWFLYFYRTESYFRFSIGSSVVDMEVMTLSVFEEKRERVCVPKKELNDFCVVLPLRFHFLSNFTNKSALDSQYQYLCDLCDKYDSSFQDLFMVLLFYILY